MTAEGWRQAAPSHVWQFPRDHGSHPEYRIEWWYYTGNLASNLGRRFGYQVTFFRVGVDPVPENPSRWAVRDLHMAHLALTDLENGRHLFGERLDRGGLGWAGARAGTLDVWNGDWRAFLDGGLHRLEVVDRSFGVDLRLEPGKGPTLHGEDGLSRKGPSAGNASQYYSMTRMPTTGRVRLDREWIDVTGASWMDHEFGTTFLEPGQVGWDWFSLQLDDGADIMVFQLRGADGRPDRHSAGTWVGGDGVAAPLDAGDVRLVPGRRWTSPGSGAAYPGGVARRGAGVAGDPRRRRRPRRSGAGHRGLDRRDLLGGRGRRERPGRRPAGPGAGLPGDDGVLRAPDERGVSPGAGAVERRGLL